MRVVFLDFDGVLNSHAFFASLEGHVVDSDDMLDQAAVARINVICARTGANVVVSSTWRILHSKDALSRVLLRHGFTGRVVGVTPVDGQKRGRQIAQWLAETTEPVESFAILDDDSDMEPLMDRLVKTQFADGIQDKHVEHAVAMLMAST